MCLFIFLFNFRRDNKAELIAEITPLIQKSLVTHIVDVPTRSSKGKAKVPSTTNSSGNNTLTGSTTPTALPGATNELEITATDCQIPQEVQVFTEAGVPNSQMLPRPPLGHRYTGEHLTTFQHPFMPPPVDQASLATTTSGSGEDSQAPADTMDNDQVQTPGNRRLRDDGVSVETVSSGGFSIGSSGEEINAQDLIKEALSYSLQNNDDSSSGSSASFEWITHAEASDRKTNGWTENVDRMLCFLWFFTAYSFNTIAAVLNYSVDEKDKNFWLHGEDVKKRLLQLMDSNQKDPHEFVYHEICRIYQDKKKKPEKHYGVLCEHLSQSWTILQAQLERAAKEGKTEHWKYKDQKTGIYKVGVGLDWLTDEGLRMAGVEYRRWSPEARDHLRELEWTGLRRPGKGEPGRPETVQEVQDMSVSAENAPRRPDSRNSKRKKGWFGRH